MKIEEFSTAKFFLKQSHQLLLLLLTVTIDCYFVLFIPFSLFTHLRQGRKMEILKAGCFYFIKFSRNRLIILDSVNSIKAF